MPLQMQGTNPHASSRYLQLAHGQMQRIVAKMMNPINIPKDMCEIIPPKIAINRAMAKYAINPTPNACRISFASFE